MVSEETGQPNEDYYYPRARGSSSQLGSSGGTERDQILQISPGCLICLGLQDTRPLLHLCYSVIA